mgnify:CR=1 FL=1
MSTATGTAGFQGFEGSYLGNAARLPANASRTN